MVEIVEPGVVVVLAVEVVVIVVFGVVGGVTFQVVDVFEGVVVCFKVVGDGAVVEVVVGFKVGIGFAV